MPKYKVTVVKHWDEYGEIIIEAADEGEARDEARESLNDGGESIQWGAMDPQGEEVESVGMVRDDAPKRKRKSPTDEADRSEPANPRANEGE